MGGSLAILADLPLPIAPPEDRGQFVPATQTAPNEAGMLPGWQVDPWQQSTTRFDMSQPAEGFYGEVSGPAPANDLNSEWGYLPAPVRDYQDMDWYSPYVATTQSPIITGQMSGPAGQYFGGQQSAQEVANSVALANQQSDYWSVILGQGPAQ